MLKPKERREQEKKNENNRIHCCGASAALFFWFHCLVMYLRQSRHLLARAHVRAHSQQLTLRVGVTSFRFLLCEFEYIVRLPFIITIIRNQQRVHKSQGHHITQL